MSSSFDTTRCIAAAVLAAATALSSAWAQTVVPGQSEIAFVSRQMGVPVEGRFKRFDAQISFDPKKPEAGKVAFTIDTASASFGSREIDAELPKAAWFNASKFPQATFVSTSIKGAGAGRYDVVGRLTIKGQSRDVLVPVTLSQNAAAGVAIGSFTIRRLEFSIGDGEWADTSMVANDVLVKFRLTLSGLPG